MVRFAAGHDFDEFVEVGQRLGELELKKTHHATLLVQVGVVGFAFDCGSVVEFRLGVGCVSLWQGFRGGCGLAKSGRGCPGEEQHRYVVESNGAFHGSDDEQAV